MDDSTANRKMRMLSAVWHLNIPLTQYPLAARVKVLQMYRSGSAQWRTCCSQLSSMIDALQTASCGQWLKTLYLSLRFLSSLGENNRRCLARLYSPFRLPILIYAGMITYCCGMVISAINIGQRISCHSTESSRITHRTSFALLIFVSVD